MIVAVAALSWGLVTGCDEDLPVAPIGGIPGEPVTVEVRIPWSDFASNLEVFGGYGSPKDLAEGFVAEDYAGTLDAYTLVKFFDYPTLATVRDSTGTLRPDSTLTYIGGRVVAFFDTIASTNTGPVNLALGATQAEWDATTVTWDFAVDTIDDRRPWAEPGAGPVLDFSTAIWDPAQGDSVVFELDSAMVAIWADSSDVTRGGRISAIDPGERLNMVRTALRLDVRPSLDPDTVITVTALQRFMTFIYTPFPSPPPDGVRIGGAPSWRTVLDIGIPVQLTGPPEFCAVVSCPHTIQPGQISYAGLVLTSRASDPAFQPSDSIRLDVRPVYDRASMPKSPLGSSLIGDLLGRSVPPAAFGSAPGVRIEVPFTSFARDLARGTDPFGNVPPSALALLSVFEPFSIAFASFEGPGSADEPWLRLVLTIGPALELP